MIYEEGRCHKPKFELLGYSLGIAYIELVELLLFGFLATDSKDLDESIKDVPLIACLGGGIDFILKITIAVVFFTTSSFRFVMFDMEWREFYQFDYVT